MFSQRKLTNEETNQGKQLRNRKIRFTEQNIYWEDNRLFVSKESSHFIQSTVSLPCLQEPTTSPKAWATRIQSTPFNHTSLRLILLSQNRSTSMFVPSRVPTKLCSISLFPQQSTLLSLFIYFLFDTGGKWGRSLLRHCFTSRQVAVSMLDGVVEIFIDIILRAALWFRGRLSL
jgi:hypothetical protein